jgi:hypothetical protein
MSNPDMRNMQDHYPHRGDQIEAWIKDRRDAEDQTRPWDTYGPWDALDVLLDEYRLAADTGQSLENIVNGEPEDVPPARARKKKIR